ncbi:MAG: xanthine dehydrogenase FAD-binding subunit XdhB [Deferrisomatales bacterium]
MKPFGYHRPGSLQEALGLLGELGEGAVPVAGATDVWARIRGGKLAPEALVSLRGVPELEGWRPTGEGGLWIGACTPHAVLEDAPWVGARYPALQQACGAVGSRQVRNVGTVGGNVCNAAPSADSAVALLLYDAVCHLAGPRAARRTVPLEAFFTGPGRTALEPGELLVGLELAAPGPREHAGYWKVTRRKGVELPLLGVGVRVGLDEEGRVELARVALGVAGPTPVRAPEAEAVLEGERLTPELARQAGEVAAARARVRDSWRGQAWYRRQMIRIGIERVLHHAAALPEAQ